MNTNGYFSFSRLGLVMKRDLMENWKTNLYVFIGIFGAYLLCYLVSMSRFNEILYLERVPSFDQYSKSHWSFFGSCAIALLLYFASHTMKNMKIRFPILHQITLHYQPKARKTKIIVSIHIYRCVCVMT